MPRRIRDHAAEYQARRAEGARDTDHDRAVARAAVRALRRLKAMHPYDYELLRDQEELHEPILRAERGLE